MTSRFLWPRLLILFLTLCIFGCTRENGEQKAGQRIVIKVWFHSGQEAERTTIIDQVARFNDSQEELLVDLTFIPERDYNAQVQAAALADDLPDILEFDGPYLYNYVWQNHILPLEHLLPADLLLDLLPSIIAQGTYSNHLYSVATFDSGLALFGDRDKLVNVGARLPTQPAQAWTIDEFNDILARLAENDTDGQVLDLKLNYSGEWFTYAFSPILQSAGADLIDRGSHSAEGVLNNPAAVRALRHIQDWIASNYVDPNIDDGAFISGRVPLSWVGHWEYARYVDALGEKLVLVPLPDFGKGSRTGQGSWNWGITRNCKHPEAAASFLIFLLRTEEVLAMTEGNGAVPATREAIAGSKLYGPDGPLRLFAEQLLQGYGVPRPRTPAYPVITTAFQKAFLDITHGAEIQPSLDKVVQEIEQDMKDSNNYKLP